LKGLQDSHGIISIEVRKLSKNYLRPNLRNLFLKPNKNNGIEILKNIDFQVEKGKVLGVMGHNGAGKSTLMRVIAGISAPTEGEVVLRGKVASILSIGVGLHPELSGRENIFVSGELLGMSRRSVEKHFDEIIEFSELSLEKIEEPVKHYSSGMFLRLAFSTIIHLDADIFLLDEVLAVGDAEFRRKCLQKINELKIQGKTFVIVSHTFGFLSQVADKVMLLKSGKVLASGSSSDMIEKYRKSGQETTSESALTNQKTEISSQFVQINSKTLYFGNEERNTFFTDESVRIHFNVFCLQDCNLYIKLIDNRTGSILSISSTFRHKMPPMKNNYEYDATWDIPADVLNEGVFYIDLYILDKNGLMLEYLSKIIQMTIREKSSGFYDLWNIHYPTKILKLSLNKK
jgi:ABC-type polysaccharide/polyol phosphate transport system ATPase subunit